MSYPERQADMIFLRTWREQLATAKLLDQMIAAKDRARSNKDYEFYLMLREAERELSQTILNQRSAVSKTAADKLDGPLRRLLGLDETPE